MSSQLGEMMQVTVRTANCLLFTSLLGQTCNVRTSVELTQSTSLNPLIPAHPSHVSHLSHRILLYPILPHPILSRPTPTYPIPSHPTPYHPKTKVSACYDWQLLSGTPQVKQGEVGPSQQGLSAIGELLCVKLQVLFCDHHCRLQSSQSFTIYLVRQTRTQNR